jgi:quercetin dioxygenase-like cupin family protein
VINMISRRQTIKTLAAGLALCLAGNEAAQALVSPSSNDDEQGDAHSAQTVALIFRHSLALEGERDVAAATVEYAPGAASAPHRHSGPVLGYVLEGAMVMQFGDQSPVTYTTGQMFFEPEGGIHQVSRNASSVNRAKILAIIFGKKGEQLTVPVK